MQEYTKNIPLNGNSSNKSLKIILTLIFTIVSIIMIAVGIITLRVKKVSQNKCTEKVSAKVVDLTTRSSSSRRNGRHHYNTTYAPVFEYYYDNQKYVIQSSISSDPPEYTIGQTVELKINPNNPKKFYDPNSKTLSMIGYIFIGVGILMMAVFIVVMIIINRLVKNKSYNETEVTDYNENQY